MYAEINSDNQWKRTSRFFSRNWKLDLKNQLYAGHGLSSELGHLDAAFRTLLLKLRSHVYGEEQFIMEERLKGNIVLNKSEVDDLSHYLKKAQYYIKLELGVFDSEDFNKTQNRNVIA